MPMITFFSLKGGTGKTTLCSTLGWLLADKGHSVLMIDLDPQGHLSQSLNRPLQNPVLSLFDVLIHGRPLAEAVEPSSFPRLSLVPAAESHLDLHTALLSQPWREWKLKDALSAMGPHPYDWILLDVGANLNLITYNALFACRNLIIPTLPDVYSYLSLKTLFGFLQKSGRDFHYTFDTIWILLNKLNNHRPLDRENRDALKKYYQRFLIPVRVREDPKVPQAVKNQVPLPVLAPQSTAVRDLTKVVLFLEKIFPLTQG
ncbi:MAG: ParA family protein [Thermodesulfobacteriota bacterium]